MLALRPYHLWYHLACRSPPAPSIGAGALSRNVEHLRIERLTDPFPGRCRVPRFLPLVVRRGSHPREPRLGLRQERRCPGGIWATSCVTRPLETSCAATGIRPAPERRQGTTWKEFIAAHREVLAAADFFTTEVWTLRGLMNYVLFFIDLASRKVHVAGMTPHPHQRWMSQIARNVTMEDWGVLRRSRLLIHDRDSKFCARFRAVLHLDGVRSVRLPVRSPNLNAFAERWVRSVKQEVSFQTDPVRRRLATTSAASVLGPLPPRAKSGQGQCSARSSSRRPRRSRNRTRRPQETPRRAAQPLHQEGRMSFLTPRVSGAPRPADAHRTRPTRARAPSASSGRVRHRRTPCRSRNRSRLGSHFSISISRWSVYLKCARLPMNE